VLERETRFIEDTEAVQALIVDGHLAELRTAECVHQVLTELAVSRASLEVIVTQVATLAILESLVHQVSPAPLGWDTGSPLAGFATTARATQVPGRTGYDPAPGWLVTTVGARGEDWGLYFSLRPTHDALPF
jgi:purine catabolism regulator